MKVLTHKSTTTVAYFALMQSFISSLSIIFHKVLSLKLTAQCIIACICFNSVLSHLPFLFSYWFSGIFLELAPAPVPPIYEYVYETISLLQKKHSVILTANIQIKAQQYPKSLAGVPVPMKPGGTAHLQSWSRTTMRQNRNTATISLKLPF